MAKVIRDRLTASSRMPSNASTIEVESYHVDYDNATEFAALGSMSFEVLPEKERRPDAAQRIQPPPANGAYFEIPTSTIPQRPSATHPMRSTAEDVVMDEEEIPGPSKGKGRELQGDRENDPSPSPVRKQEAERERAPGFKYATELQHQTSAEGVFRKVLEQPVMLTLGEVLGSSFDLSKRFLKANQSHRFPVQKSSAAMGEYGLE